MSTCNFVTQKEFPLLVWSPAIGDEEEDDIAIYDWMIEDIQPILDTFNDKSKCFDISIESGYYSGIQLMVTAKNDCLPFDEDDIAAIRNGEYYKQRVAAYGRQELINDCQYYGYDNYRDFKTSLLREVKDIMKVYNSVKGYGWVELLLVGVFSNGEGVYELADSKQAQLKHACL